MFSFIRNLFVHEDHITRLNDLERKHKEQNCVTSETEHMPARNPIQVSSTGRWRNETFMYEEYDQWTGTVHINFNIEVTLGNTVKPSNELIKKVVQDKLDTLTHDFMNNFQNEVMKQENE